MHSQYSITLTNKKEQRYGLQETKYMEILLYILKTGKTNTHRYQAFGCLTSFLLSPPQQGLACTGGEGAVEKNMILTSYREKNSLLDS